MFRSLLALILFSLPLSAMADTSFSCEGNGMKVGVEIAERSATTTLEVNGKEIPALRTCIGWANGNSHMGGKWRCPHGEKGSSDRYEVYPITSPANGDAPYVRVIGWIGDSISTIEIKDCE